jgi:hypothetical protein
MYPLTVFSQSYQEITITLNEHLQNGTLDSIQVKLWLVKNDYHQIKDYHFFYGIRDTIVDSTGDYSVGFNILDPGMEFHNRQVGEWKGYYSDGQLKYIGNYSLGATIWCQVVGPTISGYSFKSGAWTYYYINGQTEAKGTYLHSTKNFQNNCGTEKYYVPFTGSDWQYWDENGKEIDKPKDY